MSQQCHILYFLLITTLAVNTAYFRESDNSASFFYTSQSFLSSMTVSWEKTVGWTVACISFEMGSLPFSNFKEMQRKKRKAGDWIM